MGFISLNSYLYLYMQFFVRGDSTGEKKSDLKYLMYCCFNFTRRYNRLYQYGEKWIKNSNGCFCKGLVD